MQNINVNIVPDNFPQTIRYSQGDIGRQFKINVTDFDIPVGATVKIQATKPSGFGFSVAGVVAGSSVTFTTTAEMTDEAGRFQAELQITAGDDVIGTANFLMIGERNPHPEGTTDGSQGTIIPELTLLVERVEKAASDVLDMEVVATTLPAGSQATYSYDEALNKATFGIPEGQAGAGAAGVVASAYSAAKTYKVGDYVLYNSNLYRCTTAITTAEAWTAAHWTQVVLADDVTDLKTDFNNTVETVITSVNILNPSLPLTVGAIGSDGTIMTNGVYASYLTSDFIALEENTDYYFAVYSSSGTPSTQRKLLLLYDESKQPISGSHQNNDTQTQLTFNTSTNVKYVRVSSGVSSASFDHLQVAKGTAAGTLVPYSEQKDLLINLGDVPKAQVQDMIDNSGITATVTGKNLVNPNTRVVGGLQSDGSVATNGSWADYSTSDFIELDENTDYVFSTYNATSHIETTTRKIINLYDENKAVISGSRQNVDGQYYVTFNSSSAKYARVSSLTTLDFQLEKGTINTPYAPYTSNVVINKKLGDVPMAQAQKANVLYGKKWAVCGDSFTNGATDNTIDEDGRYYGFRKVYPYFIGNRNDMDIVKFFEGGRTLAYPSDGTFHNSLTDPNANCYYQNIPSDADYITIYLGINDGNHSGSGTTPDGEDATGVITLGTIDDITTATYYGAWNVVLSWLIENRPFAHIGIIVSNGCINSDWRDAQIAVAEKYGIPYIDLNGDKQTPVMIRSQNPNIASAVKTLINEKQSVDYPTNTHPNDDAHLFESTFIEEWLRGI